MGNTKKLPPITMSPPVIDAINGELAYQAKMNAKGRADAVDHGVEGQLVTLQVYTQKAMEAWVNSAGDDPSQPPLHALRKVAAISIRALEIYGCPQREGN